MQNQFLLPLFFSLNFLYDCQSAWKRSKNSRIQLPKVPIVFDFYDLLFPYTQFGFIEWVLSTLHTKFVSGRSIVQIIFLSFFMLSAIKKKRNYYSKILKYFSGDFVAQNPWPEWVIVRCTFHGDIEPPIMITTTKSHLRYHLWSFLQFPLFVGFNLTHCGKT